MKSPKIRINQEVYFVHTFDWTWHEKYFVNDIEVSRQLGNFQTSSSKEDDFILNHEQDFQPFLPRRSNFQGATLIAMTIDQKPYIKIPLNVKLSSKYHLENDTFDVTGKTGGSFHKIIDILQSRLNFSTTKYYRNDEIFGDATYNANNELSVTGQLYFIYHNKSDMTIGNHIMTHNRLIHLQYLPYLSPLKFTLWAANPFLMKQEYTYDMFLVPFHWQVWLVIIGIAILTSILLSTLEQTLLTPQTTKMNILPTKVAFRSLSYLYAMRTGCNLHVLNFPPHLVLHAVFFGRFLSILG
jgi:hypothetical protein